MNDLLTELRARFDADADPREMEIYLASRGYDARQIGEILAVFASDIASRLGADGDRGEPGRDATPHATGLAGPRAEGPTFRVMGAYERGRFAPDAWGHLLALTAAGTLSPMEREQVIERALMQTDGRVGLVELRALLESAGFDDGGAAGTSTIH